MWYDFLASGLVFETTYLIFLVFVSLLSFILSRSASRPLRSAFTCSNASVSAFNSSLNCLRSAFILSISLALNWTVLLANASWKTSQNMTSNILPPAWCCIIFKRRQKATISYFYWTHVRCWAELQRYSQVNIETRTCTSVFYAKADMDCLSKM